MTEETPYAGLFVKKADPEVLKDLDKEGKLFDAPKFEHDYPFCWRCDTPLIYYARESWFIKMTDPEVKANLIANNKTINWIPETIGTGRLEHGLKMSRTGVSAVTVTGVHLLISGSVRIVAKCFQSEALQNSRNIQTTVLMISSFIVHISMRLHVSVASVAAQ